MNLLSKRHNQEQIDDLLGSINENAKFWNDLAKQFSWFFYEILPRDLALQDLDGHSSEYSANLIHPLLRPNLTLTVGLFMAGELFAATCTLCDYDKGDEPPVCITVKYGTSAAKILGDWLLENGGVFEGDSK